MFTHDRALENLA